MTLRPRRHARRAVTLVALSLSAVCASDCALVDHELPPYGQALVVVDTDLPVPYLAARLRVDVYAADGTWVESRDAGVATPSEWPASFVVYSHDEARAKDVLVRVRSYPDGKLRDYRGERFADVPPADADPSAVPAPPTATDEPRLRIDGVDLTPRSEPEPNLAVDRLVRVRLEPGKKAVERVTLRGACIGLMANVATGESCHDTEGVRVSADADVHDRNDATTPSTLVGTFGASTPCTKTPRAEGRANGGSLHDEEVCVPGGVFILGSREAVGLATVDALPERVAVIPPLLVDRYEYTIGRLRERMRRGLDVGFGSAAGNDAPLGTSASDAAARFCTWSLTPRPGGEDREEYPVTCINTRIAKALCENDGSSLPTEAEWEYAAAFAGRAGRTSYPWGQVPPSCANPWFSRWPTGRGPSECAGTGTGPTRVTASPSDETPLGIHGMGGNVSEWVSDASLPYDSVCWRRTSVFSPTCSGAASAAGLRRGGGWTVSDVYLLAAARASQDPLFGNPGLGVRCVRRGAE